MRDHTPRNRLLRHSVLIPPAGLQGSLELPRDATAIIVFAHGSGSSRLSPRNQHVATRLRESAMGTLLFDLLTEEEALDRRNVFDIGLLAERLNDATRWLRGERETAELPLGYFGASTGAAAAIVAASRLEAEVGAIVSRGGRPDLAGGALARVRSPTLLIVGSRDSQVLTLNRSALREMVDGEIAIVQGATHLFEEPGTLDQVIEVAGAWFSRHLQDGRRNDTGETPQ